MPDAKGSPRTAFTLIELLVVIAILAVLMTMLLPLLTSARELARRVLCMQNQKSIAGAIQGFASTHNGRGPGGGVQTYGNYNGVAWDNVMNTEWFRENGKLQAYVRPTDPPRKNALTCTSFRTFGGWTGSNVYSYNRVFEAEAEGPGSRPPGTDNDPNFNRYPTADGLLVNPKYVNYMYQQSWGGPGFGFGSYFLGVQFEKIVSPNRVLMLIPSEYNSNTTTFNSGHWSWVGPVPLGTGACPWSRDLWNSFRHTLPPDRALYQKQATAVFTYADFHVDVVNPNTPTVLSPDRFNIR